MFYRLLFSMLTIGLIVSCAPESKDEADKAAGPPEHSVEIIAKDFNFTAPEQIEAGWHTFKFVNAGHAPHFFLLDYLPDTIEYRQFIEEVSDPFDIVFDSLKAGISKEEAGGMLGSMIPAWYFTGVKQTGGTGIVNKGDTAYVSMKLNPGTYVIECYIKEKGVFHTSLGMVRPLEVVEGQSDMAEPSADVNLTLTNFNIEADTVFSPGWNTVAVHFKEHPEIGGNDVHLIRMDQSTNLDSVIWWMDWMNVLGLEPPAPADFVGGSQENPVGNTAYFWVELEPGKYALLSEATAARGAVMEFEVE